MWEWRIFFKESNINQLKLSAEYNHKLYNNPSETRTDYYYDFSHPGLGLKERGTNQGREFKPILELKILLKKVGWGGEKWRKSIKHPVDQSVNPQKGLNIKKIINILESEKEISSNTEKIEFMISNLKNKTPKRIKVDKIRVQMKDVYKFNNGKDNFKLERTKIHIFGEAWHTICIESPSLQLLNEFKTEQVLNLPENIIAGYPEFISNFERK
ncbi:MAG: hypothetical protein EU547_00835 [Promethearchaeota archaeon]|nr:MAG: hypothetical protein EU547_00835 [Candidatus Lokiarchaeota archaeon]